MNNYPVPIMAYAFIGITTLVLAYATFLDTTDGKASPEDSATTLLPSVSSMQSMNPFSNTGTTTSSSTFANTIGSIPLAQAVPVSTSSALTAMNPVVLDNKPTVGGRTKRNKKKSRNTKRNRKQTSH
jgi:hypothetical protein